MHRNVFDRGRAPDYQKAPPRFAAGRRSLIHIALFKSNRKLFALYDGSIGSVLLDTVDAVEAGVFGSVSLGGENNFTVSRLKVEAILAALVGLDDELRVLNFLAALDGGVVDSAFSASLNSGNAVLAGCQRLVGLAGADDLAVCCDKVEMRIALLIYYDNKFSHDGTPFKKFHVLEV